ncbi:Serpin B11 [Thelohanellus kitauei]|uniref:Serpin B11 n=1 Tax=Thelohanellus kitauei TaxID=669202 RepID=A0A0C2JPS0_THEKT|nr:Serpin B11 [Thelohanellus kitauei]
MNEWVKYRTYGSIQHIFDGSTQSEKGMVFIHTLSYHVDWIDNFDSQLTLPEIFHFENNIIYAVYMMNQEGLHKIYDLRKNNFRVLFKPLKHGDLISAIVLPRILKNVQDILKSFKLNEMSIYYKDSKLINVRVKLPKFKIARHDDLVEALKKFEVTEIFDPHLSDFRTMTKYNVFIGNLIQVINVDIDDTNVTETDTTEDMEVDVENLPLTTNFYARWPFMFLIFSPSKNVILFSSIVMNPPVV